MAKEIKIEPYYLHEFELNHRTVKRFRQIIRVRFGFREPTDEDSTHFVKWLAWDLLLKMPQEHELNLEIRAYYQSVKIVTWFN